jgi:hypothetical protein
MSPFYFRQLEIISTSTSLLYTHNPQQILPTTYFPCTFKRQKFYTTKQKRTHPTLSVLPLDLAL